MKADLSGAKLTRADFGEAKFVEADLIEALFPITDSLGDGYDQLIGKFTKLVATVDISGNLKGANLTGAIWIDGSICKAGSIGKCIK